MVVIHFRVVVVIITLFLLTIIPQNIFLFIHLFICCFFFIYLQFRLGFAYISTYGGNLSRKERGYITISGFPKATVQVSFRWRVTLRIFRIFLFTSGWCPNGHTNTHTHWDTQQLPYTVCVGSRKERCVYTHRYNSAIFCQKRSAVVGVARLNVMWLIWLAAKWSCFAVAFIMKPQQKGNICFYTRNENLSREFCKAEKLAQKTVFFRKLSEHNVYGRYNGHFEKKNLRP